MEPLRLDVLIDRLSSDDSELEKWTAFVEKYLLFSLKQKGMEVNLVQNPDESVLSNDSCLIHLSVLTEAALSDLAYINRLQQINEQKDQNRLVKMGLIKEMKIVEQSEKLFPDLDLLKIFLIDTDTGLEVSGKDLWKKENFNSFLFKIYDLCSEIEGRLNSLHNSRDNKLTKAVYLAEASPDLISVREGIRRELLNQGFKVYPEKAVIGNGKEVEKVIMDYFSKSVLSVHLFGKLYQEPQSGDIPRSELENKLAAHFFSTKKETKKTPLPFKRIIWTPDNLVVTNEKQSAFLKDLLRDKKKYAGAEILTSSVEELKDFILEKLNEIDTNNGGNGSGNEGKSNKSQKVFIVIKEKEKDEQVQENLSSQNLFQFTQEAKDFFYAKEKVNLFFNLNFNSTLNKRVVDGYNLKNTRSANVLNPRLFAPVVFRDLLYKNYSKRMAVKVYSKTRLKNLPL